MLYLFIYLYCIPVNTVPYMFAICFEFEYGIRGWNWNGFNSRMEFKESMRQCYFKLFDFICRFFIVAVLHMHKSE